MSEVHIKFMEALKLQEKEDKEEGRSSIISKITINTKFSNLRVLSDNKYYNVGAITISFYQNLYELSFSNILETIQKTYNEVLTKEEVELIIESMGNAFLKIIEKEVEDKGQL